MVFADILTAYKNNVETAWGKFAIQRVCKLKAKLEIYAEPKLKTRNICANNTST